MAMAPATKMTKYQRRLASLFFSGLYIVPGMTRCPQELKPVGRNLSILALVLPFCSKIYTSRDGICLAAIPANSCIWPTLEVILFSQPRDTSSATFQVVQPLQGDKNGNANEESAA